MDQQSNAKRAQLEALKNSLGPVWDLLEQDGVQELMINKPDVVYIERHGRMELVDITISKIEIESVIHLLGRLNNKNATPNSPDAIINARLSGYRFAAALGPISVNGPSISIRKHSPVVKTLEDYVQEGGLSDENRRILRKMIRGHKNILVVGGTSSGKTTFMNAMVAEIDQAERIMTIEDTQELKVLAPNWVPMEANEQCGIKIRDLIKLALRYRPDRILVGEIRGGEAFDLMQAANTGHDGVIATLHASSAQGGLSRLENLVMTCEDVAWPLAAIKQSIAETFHFIIFLARRNGSRGVEQILRMDGYDPVTMQYRHHLLFNKELPDED